MNRRKTLLTKSKGLIKAQERKADFEEPIAILLRRTGKAEFYEKVKQDKFTYKHSNGDDRFITLSPRYLHTFEYGKDNFRGYILDEDHGTPLPLQPDESAKLTGIVMEQSLNDLNKFQAQASVARGKMIKQIAVGIALLILAYTAYRVVPGLFGVDLPGIERAAPVIENVARNATIIG